MGPQAQAWGGRGHHLICAVATRLVQEPKLADFLASRGDLMGHVCNIPDIHWKSREDWRKVGDPTHYLNPENVGLPIAKLPLSYPAFALLTNSRTQTVNGHSAGSLWWRADQFVRIATSEALKARESTPPSTRPEEQSDTLPYNSGVFQMMVHMGLLGHFVGDASMPFHNHSDYDGKEAGHAGIHAYYEESSVSAQPLSFAAEVETKAKELRRKQNYKVGTTVERMRKISERAVAEREAALKSDPLSAAGRPADEQGAKAFRALILRQMADSAAQLAQFWDDAYVAGGKPDLSKYRSYRYPFTPDFVAPDYLDPTNQPSPGPSPALPPTAPTPTTKGP